VAIAYTSCYHFGFLNAKIMITALEFINKNIPATCIVLPEWLTEFSKIESIAFGVWLNINCTSSLSKDGWYVYKGDWKTTDECYDIFMDSNHAE
jgi:hypothetical protein